MRRFPADKARIAVTATEQLQGIRDRVMPMLELVAAEYAERVPAGYPVIINSPAQGLFGIELEPSFSLYFTTDGESIFADYYYRSHRIDARTSASREKFAGRPVEDRRKLSPSIADHELRNLIAEVLSRWNSQPSIVHITDT
jgi:hypothetical protein